MSVIRVLILCAALAVWAYPSRAAGGGEGDAVEAGPSNRVKANFTLKSDMPNVDVMAAIIEDESPNTVSVPLVAMPAVRDGKLADYVFVSVRLTLAEGRDSWAVHEQSHWIRDAIVRASHRVSVIAPDDLSLDEARARAMIQEAVADVLGPGAVTSVSFATLNPQHLLGR